VTSEPQPPHALLRPRILIPFVFVTLVWGSTWLVIKDQIGSVPPSWSVTWRFALAALGMIVLALVRRESLRLDRSGHRLALVVGLFQFFANFQFVYRAEHHLTSGIVAVLFALLMVPNALLSWAFLKQRPTPRFLAGSAIALVGIGLLLAHEFRIAPPEGKVALGILLTALAILSASTANVIQASPAARKQAVVPLLAWAMAYGALGDAVFALVTAGPPQWELRPGYFAGIAYLALVGSVATFPLYFNLIRELGPGRAAYNGVAVPVVAMGLSTLFEGYRWTVLAGSGGALALAGLIVALRARNPAR
jgi:drug/metabolite transporter (DMT)-like permease